MQVAENDSHGVWLKLRHHVSDLWNLLDVVTLLTYAGGLVLRVMPVSLCGPCFYAARIVLAFNLMLFFFRILHMFAVHANLGPKLVMIYKMVISFTAVSNCGVDLSSDMGSGVSQVKPSGRFRLHPTSMISKHSTTPVPDSL